MGGPQGTGSPQPPATSSLPEPAEVPPADVLADLSRIAHAALGTPRLLVSLLDASGEWVTSFLGDEVQRHPRAGSLCAATLDAAGGALTAPDLSRVAFPQARALLEARTPARGYAGAALVTSDGVPFGTLAALFAEPTTLEARQRDALLALARQLSTQLELRRVARAAERKGAERLRATVERAPAVPLLDREELQRALSLLEATLESTADGVLVVDEGGRLRRFNRKFVDMWRIPPDILASTEDDRALAFVLDQLQDPDGFMRKVRDLYDHPEEESFDVLQFKDGRVFERYSQPQRLGGAVVGRVWSFRDVTEARRAEERVLELKNFTQEIVENVPAGVLYLDVQGRVTFENRYIARLFGAQPGEASPFLLQDLLTHEALRDHPRFLAHVEAMLMGEPFREAVLELATLDGRTVTVSVSGVPIMDTTALKAWVRGVADDPEASGSDIRHCLKGGILLVRDVTEQKLAEAELEETRRHMAMSEKLSALGTLVAGVAHEINNPLAYMKGTAQLTQEELAATLADADASALPAGLRERLAEALRSTDVVLAGIDRIAHITRSLKQVAKASSGVILAEDLNTLAEDVLTVAAPRLHGDVRVSCDLRARRRALACASEISQVLLNLVLNAADAMAGQPDRHLTVRTLDEDEDVVVEVEDTGTGIQAEDAHRVFTPFYTTKAEGTGLGLSLSYRIVEGHGGRLTFTSTPGVGTTFRLELPAAPQGAPEAPKTGPIGQEGTKRL